MPFFQNFFSFLSGSTTGAPQAISTIVPSSAGASYTLTRLLGSTSVISLTTGSNSNISVSGLTLSTTAAIASGASQQAVVREYEASTLRAVEYPVTLTGAAAVVAPVLTLGGTLAFTTSTASGTTVATISNVPSGVTPTLTPNDGRLVIAGDATNGWKVVVGLSASSAGTIALAVAATGATSASATVTVTASTSVTRILNQASRLVIESYRSDSVRSQTSRNRIVLPMAITSIRPLIPMFGPQLASFTATVAPDSNGTTSTMTVTAITDGTLCVGGGVRNLSAIVLAQLTNTNASGMPGQEGTYTLNVVSTVSTPTVYTGDIADTLFTGPRAQARFQACLEYPFTSALTSLSPRTIITANGQSSASYDASTWDKTQGFIALDKVSVSIPANTPFGMWETMELPAAAAGLPQGIASDSFGRGLGYATSTSSHIDADFAHSATAIAGVNTGVTGTSLWFYNMILEVECANGTIQHVTLGDSIAYGVGEGSTGSTGYGDASGSILGNKGFVDRAIYENIGGVNLNLARGSDGVKYTYCPENWKFRRQLLQRAGGYQSDLYVLDQYSHNDLTQTTQAGSRVANAYYPAGSTFSYSSRTYLVKTSGTTGSTVPTSTDLTTAVADGTATIVYMGTNSSFNNLFFNWIGKQIVFHDQIKAAVPSSKLGVSMPTPSATTTDTWLTAANQTVSTNFGDATSQRGAWINAYTTRLASLKLDFVVDPNKYVEDSYPTQTSKWKSDGVTTYLLSQDGVHPNSYGHQNAALSLLDGIRSLGTPILLDNYDTGGDPAVVEGTGSVYCQGNSTGTGSGGISATRRNTAKTVDMSAMVTFSRWVEKVTPILSISDDLQLSLDAATPASSSQTAWTNGVAKSALDVGSLPPGKYPHSVPASDYAFTAGVTGNPSSRARAYATNTQSYSHRHRTDHLLGNSQGRGTVMFSGDDDMATHRTFILPLCTSKNVPVHLNISPGLIGTSNKMTQTQLKECYQSGLIDLGFDSRFDGNPFGKTILDGGTLADLLTGANGIYAIQDWLRDNIGGGVYTRGYKHGCWAGSNANNADLPTGWGSSFGFDTLFYLASGATVNATDGTVTFDSALNANITTGMSIFTGNGTIISNGVLTVQSIASDRLSAVLSGSPGFAGTVRMSFGDITNLYSTQLGGIAKYLRANGGTRVRSIRTGPSFGTGGGFFYGRHGWGDFDMQMPSVSLSSMTSAGDENTVGTPIWYVHQAELRGQNVSFYFHGGDTSTLSAGINYLQPAMTDLMTYVATRRNAGGIVVQTQGNTYDRDNPIGSRFNPPAAV